MTNKLTPEQMVWRNISLTMTESGSWIKMTMMTEELVGLSKRVIYALYGETDGEDFTFMLHGVKIALSEYNPYWDFELAT